MRAKKRDKKTYNFLMFFSDQALEVDELRKIILKEEKEIKETDTFKFTPKSKRYYLKQVKQLKKNSHNLYLYLKLQDLGYIDLIPVSEAGDRDKKMYVSLTDKGWQFCADYETYREKKNTNIILIIIGFFTLAYYIINTLLTIYGGETCR